MTVCATGERDKGCDACNGDDMTLVELDHAWEELLRGKPHRHEVDAENPAKEGLGHLENWSRLGDASIVDEDGRVSDLAPEGIRAMAAHVGLDQFTDRFDDMIDELKTLGIEYAIVPYVAPEFVNVIDLDKTQRGEGGLGFPAGLVPARMLE